MPNTSLRSRCATLAAIALVALAIGDGLHAQCETKLIFDAPAAGDFLGRSAAIDGDTLMLGGHQLGNGGPGLLVVYERTATGWMETERLLPADVQDGDQFGGSVTVSGSRVLIGCRLNDEVATWAGAAYIFDYDGTAWQQTVKLTASNGQARDYFGYSSSVDGDTALVGAYGKNGSGGTLFGGAYIFEFDGAQWNETAILSSTSSDADARFGREVSVGAGVAAVGAYSEADGVVYLFEETAGSWAQTARLSGSSPSAKSEFGWSVDSQGGRVVVGARREDGVTANTGAAYVFEKVGSQWTEVARLFASDGSGGDEFGFSVEVLEDTILVGAPLADPLGTNSGAAYLFEYDGVAWIESEKYVYSQGKAGELAGNAVALLADTVVIATPKDSTLAVDAGSAIVFEDQCATAFTGQPPVVSLTIGGIQTIAMDFGSSSAGSFYWVLGSVSGTSPGINLGSVVLPLNPDPYFTLTLERPRFSAFGGFRGQLDGDGRATATLTLAPVADPSLAGLTIHHACLISATVGFPDLASNAVSLLLVP